MFLGSVKRDRLYGVWCLFYIAIYNLLTPTTRRRLPLVRESGQRPLAVEITEFSAHVAHATLAAADVDQLPTVDPDRRASVSNASDQRNSYLQVAARIATSTGDRPRSVRMTPFIFEKRR